MSLKKRSTRDLLKSNIDAGVAMAELVRNCLGPRGMIKMISDDKGQTKLTGDGAAIVRALETRSGWYSGARESGGKRKQEPIIINPISKIVAQASGALDVELGDGIKSMLILMGSLLSNAKHLLDDDLPSGLIVAGYKKAYEKAVQIITGLAVIPNDTNDLRNLARTSILSKDVGSERERIVDVSMAAVDPVLDNYACGSPISMHDVLEKVKFVKRSGKGVVDTELIKGLVIEKAVAHTAMPKNVDNARILVLETPLELDRKEFHAKVEGRQGLVKAFLDEEDRLRDSWVRKVRDCGANVVLCQRGMDVKTQSNLAKNGVLGVQWVNRGDAQKIAKATGARIVTDINDASSEDLGTAQLVEERSIGTDKLVFIEGCEQPKSVAVMIRAGVDQEADEVERAMSDAICNLVTVRSCNRIIGGAGAVEMQLAKELRSYALQVSSKEQLTIRGFADSLEVIPETLAKNAGLDATDVKLSLRTAHEQEDGLWMGINVLSGDIENTLVSGIIESYGVKKRVLRTAVEIASMILRTANIIPLSRNEPSGKVT